VTVTEIPNSLGIDGVVQCAGVAPTKIRLYGAARPSLTVPGSWLVLATDGRRLVLERLDADGSATGEVKAVGVDGTALPAPRFNARAIASAYRGWLVGTALVVQTPKGVSGPGWTIRGAESATVGEGRLVYRLGRTVHVRRLRDAKDRALVRLPTANTLLAAGSFGLAVATGIARRTRLYRVPWRTIDRTLPR
jgi:hypothetical protein